MSEPNLRESDLDYKNMIGTPFVQDNITKVKDIPLSVKLTDKDREMLDIAGYAFNMTSKGGILKELSRLGFEKVVLNDLGVDRLHYLTRGDRERIVRRKPQFKHYNEKGNTN